MVREVFESLGKVEVLLYVRGNHRLIRDGSPGRPPHFSHSSWALGNWKMRWPFQGIVSLWKFVNFVVFRALGKNYQLISQKLHFPRLNSSRCFLNKENCYVKSQRMHFLSILTDRVRWPSVTIRVASHYRMCWRVVYLWVAFPCHFAMVREVWKDFSGQTLSCSVQTLSCFTIRLSQLAGRTHPCLVSTSPTCSVWLWQCCWSLFFIPRDVPQIQQLLWQKYHPEEQQQHRYPSTWLLQRRRLQLGPTQIWRSVWSKCACTQFSVHWKLHFLSCDCCYVCVCVYVCVFVCVRHLVCICICVSGWRQLII